VPLDVLCACLKILRFFIYSSMLSQILELLGWEGEKERKIM